MEIEPTWVPESCTLPTAEQPFRVAEFDALFRRSVQRSDRRDDTRLDLVISPDAESTARDLAQRETECCSFFRFEFEHADDGVVMHIGVPAEHADVLDALERRVSANHKGAGS